MKARKITPALGARMRGADLSQPLMSEVVGGLCDAAPAHQVIFLRRADISPEALNKGMARAVKVLN